jgi:predicted transcriptional regulator
MKMNKHKIYKAAKKIHALDNSHRVELLRFLNNNPGKKRSEIFESLFFKSLGFQLVHNYLKMLIDAGFVYRENARYYVNGKAYFKTQEIIKNFNKNYSNVLQH